MASTMPLQNAPRLPPPSIASTSRYGSSRRSGCDPALARAASTLHTGCTISVKGNQVRQAQTSAQCQMNSGQRLSDLGGRGGARCRTAHGSVDTLIEGRDRLVHAVGDVV